MAATEEPNQYQTMHEELPYRVIVAISKILNKCWDGVDNTHTITVEILQMTKHYKWDSKVVLALLGFAMTFSEFPLVLRLYKTNPVAYAVALLKQYLPRLRLDHKVADAFFALNRQILDVTNKIVDFYDLPLHNFFTAESPEILAANSYIPLAVYWVIRSIVVSISLAQFLTLGDEGIDLLETDRLESTGKLDSIKGLLAELIENRNKSATIEKSSTADGYQNMLSILLGSSLYTTDNSKTLNILFDKPGLYDCYNKKKVSNKHLTNKVVALFITGLDSDLTTGAECAILQQTYLEKWHNPSSIASNFEVVWLPINWDTNNNWSEENLELFKSLRDQMEWYSVENPSKVDLMVFKLIIEQLNFLENPLLVVLDTQGKIVHKNGIYMMCTWGSLAYPFTTHREESLWKEMSWSIDFLIDNMDRNKDIWINEGKHICLYGGDDVKWIQKFTKIAKDVANIAAIDLEFLYVGRSKLKKRLVKVIDIIRKENLSNSLDWNIIWYFWVRLESMLYSKNLNKRGNCDSIMQGIIALLRFDAEHQNWAIISSESGDMVMANGQQMLQGLRQLLKMKSRQKKRGSFVHSLNDYFDKTFPAPSAVLDMYASHIFTVTVSKKDYEVFKVVECILESTNIHDYSKSRSTLFNYNHNHNHNNRAVFNDFNSKKRISNHNLRRKAVVLFITDLDPELPYGLEYVTLKRTYLEKCNNPIKTESQYDLVWVPVVDVWASESHEIFESLKEHMEWHSVHHPLMLPLKVIMYIRQKWNFTKKPLVVVMDTQGKIVHQNAIHSMSIWRSQAYPFSTDHEKLMWKNTRWSIDLIVDNLEPNMHNWVQEKKHICLYGGEDIDWIKKFTRIAKDVAKEANITLELLYVGSSNPDQDRVKNIIEIIVKENLSRTLVWDLIRYFWMRLESMWNSRRQLPQSKNMRNDSIIQGIDEMLNYGISEKGWAMIGMGLGKIARGSGENMLKALVDHEKWESRDKDEFVPALDEYLHTMQLISLQQHEINKGEFEFLECLFKTTHIDNSKHLNALFHYDGRQPALYDRLNNTTIFAEKLVGKIVVMIITDIEPQLTLETEYKLLRQVHVENRFNTSPDYNQFEMVWVPIAENWTDEKYKLFGTLKNQMDWYTIHQPSVVSPVVIRYIKEKWNYNNKLMLVVMNERGEIVHHNAFNMMCLWGIDAYPFSIEKEKSMWKSYVTWSLDLLVYYNLEPNEIRLWVQEGRKHICFYGGESMEWMQKFTRTAKDVAREANITLEFFYVGMRKSEERQGAVIEGIVDRIPKVNPISKTLDKYSIWNFWMRLESMMHSRLGQLTDTDKAKKDPVLKGINTILSYGLNEQQGWAVIGKGSNEIVMGNGEDMLMGLVEHNLWKSKMNWWTGFVPALDQYLPTVQLKRGMEMLGRNFMDQPDNTKPLAALFHFKDGQPALYDSYRTRRVPVETLKGKHVALFITDLDFKVTNGVEYFLRQMSSEKRQKSPKRSESHLYEVVWVPISDNWDDNRYKLFETLRNGMEWHTIYHPSAVSPVVISYIKKKWNFTTKKPMVVVMDAQAQIVNRNAFYMMCIWGPKAYPFSFAEEKLLWEKTSCFLDLIMDDLDQNMAIWMQEKRYICLYGGDDIEWIRKFTRTAKEVARQSDIPLELLYVGMRNAEASNEKVRSNIINIICKENLSKTLDITNMRFFWLRVDSMMRSNERLTINTATQPILQMWSYGSNKKGWALVSRASSLEVAMGNGEHMFKVFVEHLQWMPMEKELGFVAALDENLRKIQVLPHSFRSGYLLASSCPEFMACSECGRIMEKYNILRCSTHDCDHGFAT
ncbi:uncharacterized protein LOC133823696 [Humulus lupulus]|uniref:uncharacterized protein LOC133823696 n=1 Tax=Humulus lupulus TaxID=3486 RepID=UPI002B416D47|nr:uncharacterized protein LOC133823696 [Humulus lupulus]